MSKSLRGAQAQPDATDDLVQRLKAFAAKAAPVGRDPEDYAGLMTAAEALEAATAIVSLRSENVRLADMAEKMVEVLESIRDADQT